MDGTRVTPTAYTGRAGIPAFAELGKVIVLRFPTTSARDEGDERFLAFRQPAEECYRRLSLGRYAALGGFPAQRSETAPIWLLHTERTACGLLEDTLKAKRLIADDGQELRSAHLSFFAFATAEAGAELLAVALRHAARLGFPALFVAAAVPDADRLCRALTLLQGTGQGRGEVVTAPATIYGTGLAVGPLWNINTSEI
jgi:hypothetical protein